MHLRRVICGVSIAVLGACGSERAPIPEPAADDTSAPSAPPEAIGGQTGDDSAGGDEAVGPCVDVRSRPASLEDLVPSNVDGAAPFQAGAVLPFVLGTHLAAFEWRDGLSKYGPPTRDSQLQVQIQLRDGAFRWVERETHQGTTTERCGDEFRIGMTVSMNTADGALRERFDTELVPVSAGYASFSGHIDAEDVQSDLGSFGEYPLEALRPGMEFTRYGFKGWFDIDLMGSTRRQVDTMAYFPRWAECEGTPVLHGAELPNMGDFVAAVQSSNPFQRAGGNGEAITAVLTPLDRTACYDERYRESGFSFDAHLELNGSQLPPLEVHALGHQTGVSDGYDQPLSLELTAQPPCGESTGTSYAPEEFREKCGDWGFDTSPYARVYLRLGANFTSTGGGIRLALQGFSAGPTGSVSGGRVEQIGRIELGSISLGNSAF